MKPLGLFFEGAAGALIIAVSIVTPFLRRRRLTWGARPEEPAAALPGDDTVPEPKWHYTNAVTLRGTPDQV